MKRILTVLIVATIGAGVLIACGGGTPSTPTTPSTPSTDTAMPSTPSTDTAMPSASAPTP
jgi:hypothetical protein